jgi:hypothetical protein
MSKDILASPYWLPTSILTYPMDFLAENFRRWHSSTEERLRHSVMKT